MKNSIALFVMLLIAVPAYAGEKTETVVKNVQTAGSNLSVGWQQVMDNTHEQAAKGKGVGEQLGGVAVGTVHAARNTLYHAGAGAIDLLTFWIPKQQPLINPDKVK